MKNILTIDVEDYFMVAAFSKQVPYSSWDTFESRVVQNTDLLLAILRKFNATATFFVLGWVAERYPTLVRDISNAGHEIACHGYAHQLIYHQTRQEFISDIRKSKRILEDIIGQGVLGYRAPSFSITEKSAWALDCLIEADYKYDSSIFPIFHDKGGMPHAARFPYKILRNGQQLLEIPLSTINILGLNFPVAGGGYFRLWPYGITRTCVQYLNLTSHAAVVYLHPWELDSHQPRIITNKLSNFRHYINIDRTQRRLHSLLQDFEFQSIREMVKTEL